VSSIERVLPPTRTHASADVSALRGEVCAWRDLFGMGLYDRRDDMQARDGDGLVLLVDMDPDEAAELGRGTDRSVARR